MHLSLSNKEFYLRHNKELEKYLIGENSLHIINLNSKIKITEDFSDKLYIDLKKDYLNELKIIKKKYDLIILTDVVEVSDDLYSLFNYLNHALNTNGKLILSSINTKWGLVVKILEKFKLKDSNIQFSYIHQNKIQNIICGVGFEFIKSSSRQIYPFKIFGIGSLLNKILEAIFYKLNLGIKTYIIFRKIEVNKSISSRTIIIPAKNEEGNLEELFNRIPNKECSEIIFSIGVSKDSTLQIANKIKNNNSDIKIKVIEQSKNGKANAVWEALKYVNSETIAILDADISVEPESLDGFFEIIENNYADFVNGTRLIYPIEKNSMRYLNKLGNLFFKFVISIVIKNNLSDALCGTKVFKKSHIDNIYEWRNKLNQLDPFGDFDLIFSAAYCGEKILEYPVHYKARIYGTTQINRFRDGFKLAVYFIKSFALFNTSN